VIASSQKHSVRRHAKKILVVLSECLGETRYTSGRPVRNQPEVFRWHPFEVRTRRNFENQVAKRIATVFSSNCVGSKVVTRSGVPSTWLDARSTASCMCGALASKHQRRAPERRMISRFFAWAAPPTETVCSALPTGEQGSIQPIAPRGAPISHLCPAFELIKSWAFYFTKTLYYLRGTGQVMSPSSAS